MDIAKGWPLGSWIVCQKFLSNEKREDFCEILEIFSLFSCFYQMRQDFLYLKEESAYNMS